ncbi:unnamed protein product [Rangifer tarandus platyrhynchus]|uniref:Uncharacterized protein n=1 Tax=Rangifer tarandus platyrhynchus TaxID=3082113 RepID=A0AC59Z3U7_RANTA
MPDSRGTRGQDARGRGSPDLGPLPPSCPLIPPSPEWAAMPSSRGSSRPRDLTGVSLPAEPPGKPSSLQGDRTESRASDSPLCSQDPLKKVPETPVELLSVCQLCEWTARLPPSLLRVTSGWHSGLQEPPEGRVSCLTVHGGHG